MKTRFFPMKKYGGFPGNVPFFTNPSIIHISENPYQAIHIDTNRIDWSNHIVHPIHPVLIHHIIHHITSIPGGKTMNHEIMWFKQSFSIPPVTIKKKSHWKSH